MSTITAQLPLATYERKGNKIHFVAPGDSMTVKQIVDIMSSLGYPPAGYGMPCDIVQQNGSTTFTCWASCD